VEEGQPTAHRRGIVGIALIDFCFRSISLIVLFIVALDFFCSSFFLLFILVA
jgi:hypothetical protein